MSENADRLRAVYAAWATGAFTAGAELFAPDVAFEPIGDGRAILERGEIEPYMREFLAQWSEFRVDAEELVEVGETILVTERQHATGKGSGVETEMTCYAIWTFRDGLVAKVRWELNRARAMEAAGLTA